MTEPFAFFAPASRPLRIAMVFALALPFQAQAQARSHPEDARAIVASAVRVELQSDHDDHTAYMYRDHDITPDHDTVFYTVETPEGLLRKKLEDHGKPLDAVGRHVDDLRIHGLLGDAAAQQRARKDSSHDDNQAEEMLRLLPTAYLWSVASERGNLVTLNFKPDPAFTPKTFEARVLAAMGGQITVSRRENRIRSIQGALLDDVTFGYGIFGRLHKGGSFTVERREIVPGHWQMTETHVHIDGRALFFKTIGSQEDETRTDFKPSPAKTLAQADEVLKQVR